MGQMHKAMAIIQFKLEGQMIKRRSHYQMEHRLLLDKIDYERGTVRLDQTEYPLLDTYFPTIDPNDVYSLSAAEQQVVDKLKLSFTHSKKLHQHVRFLYSKGSIYHICNGNLLYHGCIAMNEDGSFKDFNVDGQAFAGKAFLDADVESGEADEISRVVGKVAGAEDVKVEQVSGLPQLQIKVDRAAIARYGLNVEDVNDVIESLVAGKSAGIVYEGERRINLVVRLGEASSRDIDTISALLLRAPNGSQVPLSQVAQISLVEGPAEISREDTRRRIPVELNVRGRDLGSFVMEARWQRKTCVAVHLPSRSTEML